jgi:hypothetical protein
MIKWELEKQKSKSFIIHIVMNYFNNSCYAKLVFVKH